MELEVISEPNNCYCVGNCYVKPDDSVKIPYWNRKSRCLYYFTNFLFILCNFIVILDNINPSVEHIDNQSSAYM